MQRDQITGRNHPEPPARTQTHKQTSGKLQHPKSELLGKSHLNGGVPGRPPP